jgi:alpha-tubulin suppressor-like RCC1 family protein
VPVTRGRIVLAALALALAVAAAACSPGRSTYACEASSQCVVGGEQGTCAGGFCAFPDPDCPGGMRYEPNAGGGLGGTCLSPDVPVACGEAGQACCAIEGAACGDHLRCDGGTCTSCVADLAFGRRFGCVLSRGGAVLCAGANEQGQLGLGIAGVPSATRAEVRDATTGEPILDATAVAAGRDHACAIRAGGEVWCWGANGSGQLGNNGPASPRPAAVRVVMAGGSPLADIVEIGGGYDFTCARDAAGGVWCWGGNDAGMLGDGTTTGRSVAARVLDAPVGPPLTGALDLHVGASMACVHKAGDAVWCWGRNTSGQFGDTTKANHPSPVLLATTRSLALGMWHTCYVEADTTITCSGWNGHARLGLGTGAGYSDGDHPTKEKVLAARGGAPFTGAAQVAAGGVTCALMQDSGVQCWGDSQYGVSGTGQGEVVPARVRTAGGTPLTGVARLVAGYSHVCAFKTDGEILCWGRNNDGDLGDGTFVHRGFPAPITDTCR